MFTIVYTKQCAELAKSLAVELGECDLWEVDQALRAPDRLENFEKLGLVFHNEGKSLPVSMQDFIRGVLGNCDLKEMEYMFSICKCSGPVGHALKIVEKLCAKVGCAPSFSLVLQGNEDLKMVAQRIESGEILLAKGSLGTSLYMLMHGIRG